MENRYPALALWKKRGFKKFPILPPSVIYELKGKSIIEAFMRGFERQRSGSPYAIGYRDENLLKKSMKQIVKESIPLLIDTRIEQLIDEEILRRAKITFEAQKKSMQGNKREAKGLLKEFQPSARGGKLISTKNRCFILKRIYEEMQDCVREIRIKLDVPLKKTVAYEDELKNDPEDFILKVPGILDIFEEKEFSLLTKWPSIADTSRKIICKRLRPPCLRAPITPRTLKSAISRI